ncbi:hypothetical protein BGW38_003621 [Lunasporangiospora selenospora]|uniref:Ubiquitin-like protease family profile domain-containing protein n=1 Tax=Lunasporangiospora selenospora TaxID=979761 RepID=A0A9P6KIR7_9FUNG|nr:hypothetical protein BGW38_003621 [Lunasporangiospora selenospora]
MIKSFRLTFTLVDDYDIVGTLPGFEKTRGSDATKLTKSKNPLSDVDEDEDSSAKSPQLLPTPPLSSKSPTVSSSKAPIATPTRSNQLTEPKVRINTSTNPKKAFGPARQHPNQAMLLSVHVGTKTEFTTAGMSVHFGQDRITIIIKKNATRIMHSDIRLMEYFADSATKIIQITTHERLPEGSILAPYYNPTMNSGKGRKITLLTDTESSFLLGHCVVLKQKQVETKALSGSPVRKAEPQDNINGKTKSIAVHSDDLMRLETKEFLNDTLIEFGLKYIHANSEAHNPTLMDQVYIFNPFFFQRLLAKSTKGTGGGYDTVKGWTSKVDLFRKKYIIIPINENLHWYLAIIVNPGLLVAGSSAEVDIVATLATGKETAANGSESRSPKTEASACLTNISSSSQDTSFSNTEDNEAGSPTLAGTDLEVDVDSSEVDPKQASRQTHIDAEKKCYILCLDSLGGTHPVVFKALRSYLQNELLHKKNLSIAVTPKLVAGKYSSKCPRQGNLWDCGIFLLHYADVFLRNPVGVLNAIVNRTDEEDRWALSELSTSREKYKEVIVSLAAQFKSNQGVVELTKDSETHGRKASVLTDKNGGRSSLACTGSGRGNQDSTLKTDQPHFHEPTNSSFLHELGFGNMFMRDFIHRFYPYQALKLMVQRMRPGVIQAVHVHPSSDLDTSSFDPDQARRQLANFFRSLKALPNGPIGQQHKPEPSLSSPLLLSQSQQHVCALRRSVFLNHYGFYLDIGPSQIPDAGLGVYLRGGRVPAAGTVVALYPGTLYRPGEAIFFNSIHNRYILKCNDGIYVDGKANGLSGSIYRSLNGRDNYPGITPTTDISWMVSWPTLIAEAKASLMAPPSSTAATTDRAGIDGNGDEIKVESTLIKNPLAVGQIVNNGTRIHPPNVRYQELNIRTMDCPLELQEYLPNIWKEDDWHHEGMESVPEEDKEMKSDSSVHNGGSSGSGGLDYLRTMVLVSTRAIENDEELFSTYIEH